MYSSLIFSVLHTNLMCNCKQARFPTGVPVRKCLEFEMSKYAYSTSLWNKFTINFLINIENYCKGRPATCQSYCNFV